jgi:hypothetical protein
MKRFMVAASLPRYCTVCAGEGAVQVVRDHRERRPHGAMSLCPHCGPGRLPVLHLSWRDDAPRKAS